MFGFLNIYKPKGMTSHDVISRLRKISGIKQIGHTGTLDPFAVGVLPVCIGKATRLIEYLPNNKEYIAKIQFGANTDTYDVDGNILQSFEKKIKEQDLISVLPDFLGKIEQFPPIYSAIKVNGKKLYDYARSGEIVDIKPRNVIIEKLDLIFFDEVLQTATVRVACSKGTYIRSIAFDIGKRLNCGGYLKELERVRSGNFKLENAVKLENFTDKAVVEMNLLNPIDYLPQERYILSEAEKDRVLHGMSIHNEIFESLHVVILLYGDKIYAVGMVVNSDILVKKVFV